MTRRANCPILPGHRVDIAVALLQRTGAASLDRYTPHCGDAGVMLVVSISGDMSLLAGRSVAIASKTCLLVVTRDSKAIRPDDGHVELCCDL